MIKKTVTFKNLVGEEVTKDYFFNFSRKDILNMDDEFKAKGRKTVDEHYKDIANRANPMELLKAMDEIIVAAHGVPNADNTAFIKNAATREEFENSIGYAVLFEEIIGSEESMKEFMDELIKGVEELMPKEKAPVDEQVTPNLAAVPQPTPTLTAEEQLKMLLSDPIVAERIQNGLQGGK